MKGPLPLAIAFIFGAAAGWFGRPAMAPEAAPPTAAAAVPAPAADEGSVPVGLIDINTASAAELEAIPGIGPVLAGRIIEYRTSYGNFESVDDLVNVSGIGEKTLEKMRPHVTV